MDLELGGQVAVVIGAARGLGQAIAAGFAREGATVALLDRSPDVHAAAEAVGGRGWVADATDYPAVRAAAESVRALCGRVDHVVYAAGVGSGKFGFPFWKREETRDSRKRFVFQGILNRTDRT